MVFFVEIEKPDQPLFRNFGLFLPRIAEMQQGVQGLFPWRLQSYYIHAAAGVAGGMQPGRDLVVGLPVMTKGGQQSGKFRRQPEVTIVQRVIPGLPQQGNVRGSCFIAGPETKNPAIKDIRWVLE